MTPERHQQEMTQQELLAALQERWRALQPDDGIPGEQDALKHAIQRLLTSWASERWERMASKRWGGIR